VAKKNTITYYRCVKANFCNGILWNPREHQKVTLAQLGGSVPFGTEPLFESYEVAAPQPMVEEATIDEDNSLLDLSKEDLVKMAEGLGIELPPKINKGGIVELIEAQAEEAPEVAE
jgi:hypothetical protein